MLLCSELMVTHTLIVYQEVNTPPLGPESEFVLTPHV
jgi:hypothetical protein